MNHQWYFRNMLDASIQHISWMIQIPTGAIQPTSLPNVGWTPLPSLAAWQRSSRHLNATRTWTGHRCGKWSTRGSSTDSREDTLFSAPNNAKYRGRIRRSCTFYIILPWSQQAHVLYVFFPKSQCLVAFNAANLSPAGIRLQAHGNPIGGISAWRSWMERLRRWMK